MARWATVEIVQEGYLGSAPLSIPETKLNRLISTAEAIILRAYPGIQGRIDDGRIDLILVQQAITNMVVRAIMRKHDPRSAYSRGAGAFSEGGTFKATDSNASNIALEQEDRDLLDPPKEAGKVFSFDMAPNSSVPGRWIEEAPIAEYYSGTTIIEN